VNCNGVEAVADGWKLMRRSRRAAGSAPLRRTG